MTDSYQGYSVQTTPKRKKTISLAAIILGVYLLITIGFGIYWSITPDPLDAKQITRELSDKQGHQITTGSATTGALIMVARTLLEKPGGYISNDIFPPGLWLDNISNWEFGALVQIRDLAKAMREGMSRSQSQSAEDDDLALAEPRFNFDNDSWLLPASESEYKEGIKLLESYLDRLSDINQPGAQFYARADNLEEWLRYVEGRLGDLSQQLSASVGKRQINTDLAGDSSATQSTPAPKDQEIKTPWLEIDDVFYKSRGACWALLQFLHGAEIDFNEVLVDKNALVSLQQIIRELEGTQKVWAALSCLTAVVLVCFPTTL